MADTIVLRLLGRKLELILEGEGSSRHGRLFSELPREHCPFCNETMCNYDCPASAACRDTPMVSKDEVLARLQYNLTIALIESIITAHAGRDINVGSREYLGGLETALQVFTDHLETPASTFMVWPA